MGRDTSGALIGTETVAGGKQAAAGKIDAEVRRVRRGRRCKGRAIQISVETRLKKVMKMMG